MKVLATHTLLAFALALGALPGGQCLNLLIDHSSNCCQPQASCSCCKRQPQSFNQSVPLASMPLQHCCAALPGNDLNLPASINTRTVELTADLETSPAATADLPSLVIAEPLPPATSHHPPSDLPLFLRIHALLV